MGKKYFYEKSHYPTFKSNITYHEILQLDDDEFDKWARLIRKEVTEDWDVNKTPPVTGRTEEDIIESFSKLRGNDCDFWDEDPTDDESLGILYNFNKDASPINQFFPTMLKTKISIGKSSDGSRSQYDAFADPDLEEFFVKTMKRTVKRDSMYSWGRSLTIERDDNPFWNGQTPVQFIKDVHDGKVFTGKWKNYDIVLSRTTEPAIKKYGKRNDDKRTYGSLMFLTGEEVRQLKDEGYLNKTQLSIARGAKDSKTLKSGKVVKYLYNIRWYDTTEKLFPKMIQAFRLGLGQQPVVNFPALTAKWIYENYTDHIEQDEPLHIYDSSAGWGGRIIGAMSSRKDIHYIGTDPNPDNYIEELGKSRYEYLAEFYNENCVDNYTDTHNMFFEIEKQSNTYDLFQDGSEKIHLNPDFQKYKGKLDFSFTSPPYFNRERYGDEGTGQSWDEYSEYDDWRDNFLKPTLTTIYNYMKPDRYILWNIASIKISKNVYFDLEGDSIQILKDLGCEYKGKLKMVMASMVGADASKRDDMEYSIKNIVKYKGRNYKYEPIFVFYKK